MILIWMLLQLQKQKCQSWMTDDLERFAFKKIVGVYFNLTKFFIKKVYRY